jgi:hypothetical protein
MGLKNRMPSMVCNLIGKWWNHFIVHYNKRMLIDQTGERNILSHHHHHRQQGLTMWGGSTRHSSKERKKVRMVGGHVLLYLNCRFDFWNNFHLGAWRNAFALDGIQISPGSLDSGWKWCFAIKTLKYVY